VVVEAKFLDAGNFSDGLSPVKTADGWGFIDRVGKMVISPEFDSAEVFQNGLARVTVLGKEAYVTTTGVFVVDPFPGTTVRAERARLVAANAAYFGIWDKTETGGYVKVIISGSPEKPRVHLWGSCLPQNCDDGEADGRWDGSTLITTFRLNNQPVEFRLTLDRSVNLQLNCHSPTGTDCVTMSYTKSTPTRP